MSKVEEEGADGAGGLSTWERRLLEAKKKHRPTLKNWANDGFGPFLLREKEFRKLADKKAYEYCKNIDRVHCDQLSMEQFVQKYEEPAIPVVIGGVPASEGWSATNQWTNEDFSWLKDSVGDRLFKVGEDDDGYKVKVKFKYFLRYLQVSPSTLFCTLFAFLFHV